MENLSLEMLAKQLAELSKKSAEQEAMIAKQSETIVGLQASSLESKAEEKKPLTVPKETVKVDGKEYRFTVAAFMLTGSDKKHVAEEVATNEALLKKVLAIEGQGILRELV